MNSGEVTGSDILLGGAGADNLIGGLEFDFVSYAELNRYASRRIWAWRSSLPELTVRLETASPASKA